VKCQKKKGKDILRVHYKFHCLTMMTVEGPTGPDYAIVTMTPRKADLKNRIAKQMDLLTIYFERKHFCGPLAS